jgi:hypothetical protein
MSELEETLAGQLRILKVPAPVREHSFAKEHKRRFRFDFAWPDHMLAAEWPSISGILFVCQPQKFNGFARCAELNFSRLDQRWRGGREPSAQTNARALGKVEANLASTEKKPFRRVFIVNRRLELSSVGLIGAGVNSAQKNAPAHTLRSHAAHVFNAEKQRHLTISTAL